MRVFILLLISVALCYAEVANPGEFPYYALYESMSCAGIILTENLVLFSAKCTNGMDDFYKIRISVGNAGKEYYKPYLAKRIFPEEKYLEDPRAYDIGFLAVTEKIEFNAGVQPAKRIYESNGNEKAWKVVYQKSRIYSALEYSTIPAIQSSSCRSMLKAQDEIFFRQSILYETGACVMRNSKERMDDTYLLTSEDGDVYGLPYYFSDRGEGPDVFLVVNNYMDIINDTIEKYENTK